MTTSCRYICPYYAIEEFLVSIISYSEILSSLSSLQNSVLAVFFLQLVDTYYDDRSAESPRSSMAACRLNLWGPSICFIYEYGTIMCNIIVYIMYIAKSINNDNHNTLEVVVSIFQVSPSLKKPDFCSFSCIPWIYSCMETLQVGVMYSTLLDSNEGGLKLYHIHHIHSIYHRQYSCLKLKKTINQIEKPYTKMPP